MPCIVVFLLSHSVLIQRLFTKRLYFISSINILLFAALASCLSISMLTTLEGILPLKSFKVFTRYRTKRSPSMIKTILSLKLIPIASRIVFEFVIWTLLVTTLYDSGNNIGWQPNLFKVQYVQKVHIVHNNSRGYLSCLIK